MRSPLGVFVALMVLLTVGIRLFGAGFSSKPKPVAVAAPLPPPAEAAAEPLLAGMRLVDVDIGSKILPEATVLSVTATTVSFRCGNSIINVEIGHLAPELGRRAAVAAKAVAAVAVAAPRLPPAARRAQRRVAVDQSAEGTESGSAPAVDLSAIREFAETEAANYFRHEYKGAITGWSYQRGVRINECEPVAGWEGQYRASGSTVVTQHDGYHASSQRTVNFEIRINRDASSGALSRADVTLK